MGGKEARMEFEQIVLNQIKENDPPITRITYNRLMKLINNEKEVIRMLTAAIATEVYYVMKEQKPFNLKRYSKILKNLPDESYLED